MTRKQIDILEPFVELVQPSQYWRNYVYYGGRSSGKSHGIAQCLIMLGQSKKYRILCTREIQNTIKDSVHKLLADYISKWGLYDYEVGRDFIRNKNGTEFIFRGLKHNINELKSTEGIDIAWVEEAQSASKDSLDILTPTVRKEGSILIFSYNRFNELDPVHQRYVIDKPPLTYVRKMNYDILERKGLLPDVIKIEIEADRANPALFAHKWLGEPINQADNAIMDRQKVLQAMQQTVDDDGQVFIGVDVARMGDDRTVMFKRKGLKTISHKVYSKLRTTEVCNMVEDLADYDKLANIRIDDTGVGGGVTDELIERGYNVEGINFGGVPMDKDKYPNWISEAWFGVRDLLDEAEIPYDPDLLMELTTRLWKQDNKGKRAIETKGEYKKRGFRSPDCADALIICYAPTSMVDDDDIAL